MKEICPSTVGPFSHISPPSFTLSALRFYFFRSVPFSISSSSARFAHTFWEYVTCGRINKTAVISARNSTNAPSLYRKNAVCPVSISARAKRDLKGGTDLGGIREFPRTLGEIPLRDGTRRRPRLRSTGIQMRQSDQQGIRLVGIESR